MKAHVQVLTSPTVDTPGTTLLLYFDDKRYLIGSLAEGTQRACVQMSAKLLKLSTAFITGRTEWSNVGGMMGTLLTLADTTISSNNSAVELINLKAKNRAKRDGFFDHALTKKKLEDEAKKRASGGKLTFLGPPNLNYLLATARRFVFRKGLPIELHEIVEGSGGDQGNEGVDKDDWSPYWADSNIKVWAMSILPSTTSGGAVDKGNQPRKRNIDEVDINGADDLSGLSQKEKNLLASKAIVSDMFNSSWRLDTLHETPLSQVKLPAVLFVRNSETNKIEKYTGPIPGNGVELTDPDRIVLVRRPWPGALVESLPETTPAKEAISYIFRGHDQRGKFLPQRAKELNVPHGPDWGRLAEGHSVVNSVGDTITSEMVTGESRPGTGFAVIDIPDPSYIDNLIRRPEWKEKSVMTGVGAVFWFCGRGVATDQRLVDFMNQQLDNLEHIISSPEHCSNGIALESAAASTARMMKVDSARFNIPVHHNTPAQELPNEGKFHAAQRGQVFRLAPDMAFDTTEVVPRFSFNGAETEVSEGVLIEAEKGRKAIQADEEQTAKWAESIPDKDAEIIALGTGSSLPSKYRNVSATLVRVPGWGCMLFDAGENTIGQLKRVFPPIEFKQVLQELRTIFISHLHADHHLGIASVIKAWYEEVHKSQPLPPCPTDQPVANFFGNQRLLTVIAEPAMLHWLAEYSFVEDFGYSCIAPLHISYAIPHKGVMSRLNWMVPASELAQLSTQEAYDARLKLATMSPSLIGFSDVQAVPVSHCHGARAYSATLPSSFKVSFSGDCRPSKAFAQIGQGSTVCIHEATFDDEMRGDALAKRHTTTSEALGVAQAMRAKTCVLTHFSQRYQKLPVFENGADEEERFVTSDLATENDDGDEAIDDDTPGVAHDMADDVSNIPIEAGYGEDMAATFPDQTAAVGPGQKYELPSDAPPSAPERNNRQDEDDGSAPAMTAHSGSAAVNVRISSDMKVCVAFDYMRIRVGEIGEQAKFTPALLQLFSDEEAKERERRAVLTEEARKNLHEKHAGKNAKRKADGDAKKAGRKARTAANGESALAVATEDA